MFRIDVNSSTWCYWKQYLSLHYANFIQCGLKINVKNNKMKQYIITIRIEYKIKKNEIYKHRAKWYLYLQSQCIARKRGWAFLRMSQVIQVYLVFFFVFNNSIFEGVVRLFGIDWTFDHHCSSFFSPLQYVGNNWNMDIQ